MKAEEIGKIFPFEDFRKVTGASLVLENRLSLSHALDLFHKGLSIKQLTVPPGVQFMEMDFEESISRFIMPPIGIPEEAVKRFQGRFALDVTAAPDCMAYDLRLYRIDAKEIGKCQCDIKALLGIGHDRGCALRREK